MKIKDTDQTSKAYLKFNKENVDFMVAGQVMFSDPACLAVENRTGRLYGTGLQAQRVVDQDPVEFSLFWPMKYIIYPDLVTDYLKLSVPRVAKNTVTSKIHDLLVILPEGTTDEVFRKIRPSIISCFKDSDIHFAVVVNSGSDKNMISEVNPSRLDPSSIVSCLVVVLASSATALWALYSKLLWSDILFVSLMSTFISLLLCIEYKRFEVLKQKKNIIRHQNKVELNFSFLTTTFVICTTLLSVFSLVLNLTIVIKPLIVIGGACLVFVHHTSLKSARSIVAREHLVHLQWMQNRTTNEIK